MLPCGAAFSTTPPSANHSTDLGMRLPVPLIGDGGCVSPSCRDSPAVSLPEPWRSSHPRAAGTRQRFGAVKGVLALRAAAGQPLTAITLDKQSREGYARVRLQSDTEGTRTHSTAYGTAPLHAASAAPGFDPCQDRQGSGCAGEVDEPKETISLSTPSCTCAPHNKDRLFLLFFNIFFSSSFAPKANTCTISSAQMGRSVSSRGRLQCGRERGRTPTQSPRVQPALCSAVGTFGTTRVWSPGALPTIDTTHAATASSGHLSQFPGTKGASETTASLWIGTGPGML